ncbi:hypothetical protein [Pyxidicoccus xibeiensis]|uniref:hypothetical protein n=1 Tax=Pyxidicoccus xibeiensis TaxID=2906759 RepID=UPI0020A7DA5D|nr:hypothetical protein [Pyxidicoccus xibeiensis]MCP3139885.1 hypothetical protein [Pyxidicoccus xibeiensis]
MNRRVVWGVLCAALTWMGCGGSTESPEPGAEDALATAEQELFCGEGDAVASGSTRLVDSTCAGPWQYELQCYKANTTASCAVDYYGTSACCRVPENGMEYRANRQFSGGNICTTRRITVCDEFGQHCTYDWVTDCQTPCSTSANRYITNNIPAEYRTGVSGRVDYADEDTCTYTILNHPVYFKKIAASCTTGSWDYGQCQDTTKPTYKSCRSPNHGVATDCAYPKYYTQPGRTLDGAHADAQPVFAQTQANTLAAVPELRYNLQHYKTQPVCTTTETMALGAVDGTLGEAAAKYTKLRSWYTAADSIPTTAVPTGIPDRAGFKSQLVKRMKQVYELRASRLSVDDQQHAISLYTSAPNDTPSCGNTWAPQGTSCNTSLDASLKMCNRMTEAHPTNLNELIVNACANLAQQVGGLPAGCTGTTWYRDELRRINLALLNRNMTNLSGTLGSQARVDHLRYKLSYIDQWYTKGRDYLYPAGLPDAKLQADASALLKTLWNTAYLDANRQGSVSSDAQAEAVRKKVLSDGLVADRQMLTAAFTPLPGGAMPMTHAPLLMVMGDSLRGVEERLKDVSQLHDLGCRFKTCTGAASATSQLWSLMANLDDAATLNTLKDSATLVDAKWRLPYTPAGETTVSLAPFTQLAANHSAFQSAVKDALGLPSSTPYTRELLAEASVDQLSQSAQGVASLLKDAKVRVASYATNGLFSPSDRQLLNVGLDRAKQAQIVADVDTTLQSLDQAILSYEGQRQTLVNALLAQMQSQQAQDGAVGRMEVLHGQMADLSLDLNGLRISHAVDEARYGDFMKGFEALVPAIQASGQQMVKNEQTLNLDALSDTRYVSGDDVRNMRVLENGTPFTRVLAAGETLNVEVSGQWAPTCALTHVPLPGGKPLALSNSGGPILTGPEGYSFNETSSSYEASSNQTVTSSGKYENWSWGAKLCAGLNLNVPIVKQLFSFTASLTGCVGYDAGRTWSQTRSETNSDGKETRSSFSMARGVRSDRAPFPDQPVGALLLVQMPPDQSGVEYSARADALSVQVVQAPYTSILADKPSKFYLVVNDLVGCSGISSQALSARVVHMQPKAAAARDLAKAMLVTQTALRPSIEAYVAQGRMLPSQATHLRNTAYQKLYETCADPTRTDPENPAVTLPPCQDLSYYPESLHNLFETWISKEIVDAEREVELVQIERQIRALVLEANMLAKDYEHTQAQARMLALAPAWALRNLDGKQLRRDLALLEQLMADRLSPVIDLLHPETLAQLTLAEKEELNDLTELDPLSTTVGMVEMAREAQQAADAVRDRLVTVRTGAPAPTLEDVFVSIPRPDKVVNTNWSKVDLEVSQSVWSNLLAGKDVSITLHPKYFYLKGQEHLSCSQTSPIIRTMGLYVATTRAFPVTQYSAGLVVSPEMRFPAVSGMHEYDFINPNYLAPATDTLLGPSGNALSLLQSYWNLPSHDFATGLSPFTTFHVSPSGLRSAYPNVPHPDPVRAAAGETVINPANPLASADELIIGLRLEPKLVGPNATLPGVPQCQ